MSPTTHTQAFFTNNDSTTKVEVRDVSPGSTFSTSQAHAEEGGLANVEGGNPRTYRLCWARNKQRFREPLAEFWGVFVLILFGNGWVLCWIEGWFYFWISVCDATRGLKGIYKRSCWLLIEWLREQRCGASRVEWREEWRLSVYLLGMGVSYSSMRSYIPTLMNPSLESEWFLEFMSLEYVPFTFHTSWTSRS